ncbi:hypothetical protein NSB25_28030 [Acetatifactor muris]|uniref:Uncharacterized protein n=1 Tax=Acetatifactor muris TaxID=879566 RepID=A0A2K4ZQJ2_9FIRM|nr:hypothetical protein [Acetatifactor muris]MCR2051070.1 hypothetical protein [Acetatifactor muris]SOY32602.1 hypothetical protein AMURIS_05367 [Acetatifactor muris]
MGFLKSIGKAFVEEVPTENNRVEEDFQSYEEENVEVELDSVNTDTLIDDIYAQNELYDQSQSIFKVEELINSLPKEMVTETKRASVLSILSSFGLAATEVTDDGEKRMEVLDSVKEKINTESKDSISKKEEHIEEFKKNIANLESEIASEQNEVKISNEAISTEIGRIKELVKFVGGTN